MANGYVPGELLEQVKGRDIQAFTQMSALATQAGAMAGQAITQAAGLAEQQKEFIAREQRLEATSVLEALVGMYLASGAGMGGVAGPKSTLDWSKMNAINEQMNDLMRNTNEGFANLKIAGAPQRVQILAAGMRDAAVKGDEQAYDYYRSLLDSMLEPQEEGFYLMGNVIRAETFGQAGLAWAEKANVPDPVLYKGGQWIRGGIQFSASGLGAEINSEILREEEGFTAWGGKVKSPPDTFFIATDYSSPIMDASKQLAYGNAYITQYISKVLPRAYDRLRAIPAKERTPRDEATLQLLEGIAGTWKASAAEYTESLLNPNMSRLTGVPAQVDMALGVLGISAMPLSVNPAQLETSQVKGLLDQYMGTRRQMEMYVSSAGTDWDQMAYAVSNRRIMQKLGESGMPIFTSIEEQARAGEQTYYNYIDAQAQNWIHAFNKSGLKDEILAINGAEVGTMEYDRLSEVIDRVLKDVAISLKTDNKDKARELVEELISIFVATTFEKKEIEEGMLPLPFMTFPMKDPSFDFMNRFVDFFNGNNKYGLPRVIEAISAKDISQFEPFTQTFFMEPGTIGSMAGIK